MTTQPQADPSGRPQLGPQPTTRWYHHPRLLLVLSAGLVIGWLALKATVLSGHGPPPGAADPPPPADAVARADGRDAHVEAAAREAAFQSKLAAAKVAQQRVAALGDEVLGAVAEGQLELDRWEAEVPPLLTGEPGRRVAARPELVALFRAAHDLDRPTRGEFDRLKALTLKALEPARAALDNPHSGWDQTQPTTKALLDLRGDATAKRNQVREARRRVTLLLAQAGDPPPPDAPTLAEAVRRAEAREAEELAADVRAAREKARLEAKALLAETAAEAVRQAGRAEAKREAAKAELERTKVELEAEAIRGQARKERLRARLKEPEVLQDLAIFTAKGYSQPGPGGTGGFDKTDVFGPVSYTRLKTGGYLEPTPDGLKKLLRLGAEPAPGNDRPKWKFPAFRLDQSNEAYLKRVQGLLVELGPVMAEDGLLAR